MRFVLAFMLLFIPLAPLMACEGFEQDMKSLESAVGVPGTQGSNGGPRAVFAKAFENSDQLWNWTQGSTLGGGRVEEAEFDGRKFVFAYRSYTSGVKSSDAAVYMQEGEGWKLVKAYPVLMGKWIVADKGADQVVFHPENEAQSLMTLSKSDVEGL